MTPAESVPLPPESDYVVVEDGHLSVSGERQRFWAVIGKPFISADVAPGDSDSVKKEKIEKARKGTDVLVQRFVDLGFNAVRLWNVLPGTDDYAVGDGSSADSVDYFISEIKKRGFRIWAAGLGNRVGDPDRDAVSLVDDPATAEAWVQAVDEYNVAKHVTKKGIKRKSISATASPASGIRASRRSTSSGCARTPIISTSTLACAGRTTRFLLSGN